MSLTINQLSKKSESGVNLRDLTFSVERGEIFGILGADQSSKTDILRLLSGIDKQSSGTIFFDGKPIENGREAGFYYLGDETSSRWRNIFSSTKTESQAVTHSNLLRAALPKLKNVFLVENPVQNLDITETKIICKLIKETTRQNKICTVVVTNDPLEIFQLCDRVAILNDGMFVQVGTPEEVYTAPNCLASASLFGNNNLIAARRLTSSKTAMPEFFTIDGEHRIITDQVDKSELGAINQTIFLAILPEHLALSFGASFPEDNLLKVKITQIDFLGPTTAIRMDANGLQLNALVLRTVGLNIGDECMVGLPPDRIRVLKH
ncbi:MAG: ATP-binding cassette domain-containing protein [Acidobacteria bacterium]|nr:ATP-binding cassette domain-containing protein [Acidobacteriota bacterium]